MLGSSVENLKRGQSSAKIINFTLTLNGMPDKMSSRTFQVGDFFLARAFLWPILFLASPQNFNK